MRQASSEKRVMELHPAIRDEVLQLINKAEEGFPANMAVGIPQGYRSIAYQNDLYAQGRTKPGKIVTKAKGGSSYHNYGLAFDFCLLHDKDGNGTYEVASWNTQEDFDKDGIPDWKEVVKLFTDAGYEWGGAWATIVDAPHLQKRFGYNWRELLKRYNAKDFIPGTEYVRL